MKSLVSPLLITWAIQFPTRHIVLSGVCKIILFSQIMVMEIPFHQSPWKYCKCSFYKRRAVLTQGNRAGQTSKWTSKAGSFTTALWVYHVLGIHHSSWRKGHYYGFPSVSSKWNVTLYWTLHSAVRHGRFRACCYIFEMGNWNEAAESWEQGAISPAISLWGKPLILLNAPGCNWFFRIPTHLNNLKLSKVHWFVL